MGLAGSVVLALPFGAFGCSSGNQMGAMLRRWVPLPEPFSVPLPVPPVLEPVRTDANVDYYEIRSVTIHAVTATADHYRARFDGPVPSVRVEGGAVTVKYAWTLHPFDWRRRGADIALNAQVPWRIAVGGGVSRLDADLSGLRLRVSIDSPNNVQYRCAEDSVFHVYLSPEHTGKSSATLASWGVDDIEKVVDALTKVGVTFEQYDEPGLKTDEKGIATFEGDAKVAYFKDLTATPSRSLNHPAVECAQGPSRICESA